VEARTKWCPRDSGGRRSRLDLNDEESARRTADRRRYLIRVAKGPFTAVTRTSFGCSLPHKEFDSSSRDGRVTCRATKRMAAPKTRSKILTAAR
jgi:hypothetical protein